MPPCTLPPGASVFSSLSASTSNCLDMSISLEEAWLSLTVSDSRSARRACSRRCSLCLLMGPSIESGNGHKVGSFRRGPRFLNWKAEPKQAPRRCSSDGTQGCPVSDRPDRQPNRLEVDHIRSGKAAKDRDSRQSTHSNSLRRDRDRQGDTREGFEAACKAIGTFNDGLRWCLQER